MKAPVTERALLDRINRHLGNLPIGSTLETHRPMAVVTARGDKAHVNLGDFFLIDNLNNDVIRTRIDLEDFGRELGVLHEGECFNRESEGVR